jgi:hypothetical protein
VKKKTKKTKFTNIDPIMTYGSVAAKIIQNPNIANKIFNTCIRTNFGDQYQIERMYKNKNTK